MGYRRFDPLHRTLVPVLVFCLLPWLVACAHPRSDHPHEASQHFDRLEETRVGRQLIEAAATHPGDTALYRLGDGRDAFAARALAIRGATRAVDAQYYIWHDDLTGKSLLRELLAAADRGVRVRLLIDDLGSAGLDPLTAALDVHENLEVRLFNPFARGPWQGLATLLDGLGRLSRLNHRMHNKMLTADGVLAVVGGRNIGDEYFDAAEGVNFADLDLMAFGPVLPELGESFDLYWNSEFAVPIAAFSRLDWTPAELDATREALEEHARQSRETVYAQRVRESHLLEQLAAGELPLIWAPTVAMADLPEKVVARGEAVEATLLRTQLDPIFEAVETDLEIVSPYFIPRDRGVAYLCGLVERGVRVRILTNSLAATDVGAVHAGYSAYRKDLLACGVSLFELKRTGAYHEEANRSGFFGSSGASLHAKTFVIDGSRVFVGSLNLDPRSVDLNTELGLVVESTELADVQAAKFEVAVGPELSWSLALDEDGDIVWTGTDGGQPQRYTVDPMTSWWARFKVGVLGLLPIEGQL